MFSRVILIAGPITGVVGAVAYQSKDAVKSTIVSLSSGWTNEQLFWTAFYVLFFSLIAIGAFFSWLHKRIVAARPHTRPCPPTDLDPCMLLSATKLSAEFEAGNLTSAYVTECYIQHIERINPYLNALVYELYTEAREQAAAADKKWSQWRRSPRTTPKPHWLCGVPCTIKESIQVKSCPNSSGHPRRTHIYAKEDSVTVERLRSKGCVIVGLTNISELCMWMEANNKVYGITCNPYDTRRLVGGSSGGEGAAVAACFAAFGLGADVGGSIRMPAFFNGVFGYKPSAHLIPNKGQHPGARGRINHLLATGPICRFAEDMLPLARVLAEGGYMEDPERYPPASALPKENLPSLAERALNKGKPLRVFAITDFGLMMVPVAESQKKAVLRVAEHLEQTYKADVTILNFRDPSKNRPIPSRDQEPKGWGLFRLILPMWTAHMTYDKEELSFSQFMSEGSKTGPIQPYREFIRWICGRSIHTAMSVGLCVLEKTDEIFNNDGFREAQKQMGYEFREAVQRELADENTIIICPTYPVPAPKHHEPTWIPFQWQYTAAFNISQVPAINVPVWDEVWGDVAPTYEGSREAGRPKDHHIPKGVQVVSGWGHDGLALSVAATLERDGLAGYRYPSWSNLPQA